MIEDYRFREENRCGIRTLLERSCVRVLAVAFRTSSHRSCTSHARFGVDVTREKKTAERRRTTKSEREKKGALRGRLSRRISLGVCPPGRGERAVTERDGVTKEGTRMRWNGTYTFFFLPHRCFAEEGAYSHGAHGNAQAPSAEDPRPFDEYPVSLAFSLSCLSHLPPITRPYFPSFYLPLSSSVYSIVYLRLHHFSFDPVTIPMAAFSP